jgi:hypothetical protein
MGKGLSATPGWREEDQKRAKRQIAEARARDLESRDKLKRMRWTPSPAPTLGFDPEIPDPEVPFAPYVRRA